MCHLYAQHCKGPMVVRIGKTSQKKNTTRKQLKKPCVSLTYISCTCIVMMMHILHPHMAYVLACSVSVTRFDVRWTSDVLCNTDTVQYHQSKLVQHCRFNRVRYTIQAVHTAATADQSLAPIADAVQQVEAKLLQKKTELRKFESEFRQVCKPLPPCNGYTFP